MSEFSSDQDIIGDLSSQVIKNVQKKFNNVEQDSGVLAAFKFLVLLSCSTKGGDTIRFLNENGIGLKNINSHLQIAKAAGEWIEQNKNSNEYASVAKGAVIDAIGIWQKQHQSNQGNLFFDDPNLIWRMASNGAGFCELSRLFFSKFTERYLKYFLEREASSSFSQLSDRNNFSINLEKHVQEISIHAFETAKITQSFAAGWFNKNAKDKLPSDREVEGFLSIAFGKMRTELLREEMREELL